MAVLLISIPLYEQSYKARLFRYRARESIRAFDPESQLSNNRFTEVTILPAFDNTAWISTSLLELLPSTYFIAQYSFLEASLENTYNTPPSTPEDNIFDPSPKYNEMPFVPRNASNSYTYTILGTQFEQVQRRDHLVWATARTTLSQKSLNCWAMHSKVPRRRLHHYRNGA